MYRLILAPVFLWLAAFPAAAEELSLSQISGYLNDLTTAEAEFTQINSDGTIATGRILIRRPGRARFEYNPPNDALVIAGGSQLAIFDGKSNTGPTQYPLKRTPLGLILAKKVDLDQANMIVGHSYDGTATSIVAQDPEHPEYGSIQLLFTDSPVELRQWVITDGVGDQTTLILGGMETGLTLANNLFSITAEISKRADGG